MKNDTRMHSCGPVPNLEGKNLKVGSKQIRKAIASGCAKAVYLALDADPCITEPIEELSEQMGIHPIWIESQKALGKACRIDVGAAAAAIVD